MPAKKRTVPSGNRTKSKKIRNDPAVEGAPPGSYNVFNFTYVNAFRISREEIKQAGFSPHPDSDQGNAALLR